MQSFRRKTHFFLAFSFVILLNSAGVAQQNKHALIIAIGSYEPGQTKWPKLASLNDVPLLQTALQRQGFKDENIAIVKDTDATGIINAFNRLKESVKTGDIAIMHYSGHGVQLQDDNSDEPDKLDEALVPLGAKYDLKDLTGSNYLRDDVLGDWLLQIRQKLGPEGQLLLILDSCHSGSGARGITNVTVRGGLPPLINDNFKPQPSNEFSQSLNDSPATARGKESNAKEGLSKFVLFAGASSNENNYETFANGKSVGSLSLAVSKVLTQLQPTDTYRKVFARIRAEMAISAPRQNPVIEGDMDLQVFGGQIIKQASYVDIRQIKGANLLELNGGLVNGINKGDVFVLFPAGKEINADTSNTFEGEVKECTYFSALLSMKKRLPDGLKAAQYSAFRTKQSYSETKIRIAVQLFSNAKLVEKQLVDSLSKWPFLEIVTPMQHPDLLIKDTGNAYEIIAIVADVNLPYLNMSPVNLKTKEGFSQLKKALISSAQVKFIKTIRLKPPSDAEFNFDLVRAELGNDNHVTKIYDTAQDTLARRFSEKDVVVIKITNRSRQKLYYNVIAIQPDDKIVPVAPGTKNQTDQSYDPNDVNSYQIEAGQTLFLDYRPIKGFYPPCGTEVMKVFATPVPINLYPVIETQGEVGVRGNGEENPLEMLMAKYYSRGPAPTSPINSGITVDYVYTIVGSKENPCVHK
jgi:metacaspase-1